MSANYCDKRKWSLAQCICPSETSKHDKPTSSAKSDTIGDPAIAGQRARTKREEFYLRMARLLWHDCMDGYSSLTNSYTSREFYRLMKLAKAKSSDL